MSAVSCKQASACREIVLIAHRFTFAALTLLMFAACPGASLAQTDPSSAAKKNSEPASVAAPPASPSPGADCLAALGALGMKATAAPQPVSKTASCVVETPVQLTAMTYKTQEVQFPDRPILDCRAARTLGSWLRDLALPLAEAELGAAISAVETGPGFECRNRNRATAGKLSAHATGLAVDIARVKLANGLNLVVAKPEGESQKRVLDAWRKSACGWFTTVLGPGSDAAHADHLHFDVEKRGTSGTGRFCQ